MWCVPLLSTHVIEFVWHYWFHEIFFILMKKRKNKFFQGKKMKMISQKKSIWNFFEIILSGINSFCPLWHHTLLEKKNEITNSHKIYLKKILKKPDLYPPRIFSYLTHSFFFSIHKSLCVLIQNLFFFDNHTPSILLLSLAQFFFSVSVLFGFNSHHLTKKCVDCKMKMKMLKNRLSKILMIGSIFHSAPDSVFLNRNVKFDT